LALGGGVLALLAQRRSELDGGDENVQLSQIDSKWQSI